jgi:hypothetical protein
MERAGFPESDQAVGERPQLLGFRNGGLDPLGVNERIHQVPQQRLAVRGLPSKLPVVDSMAHRKSSSLRLVNPLSAAG